MAKIFEELFTLNLNKIAVNVWYVSSTTPVVLHAGLNDQLGRMQMNKQYKRRYCLRFFCFRSGT